MKQGLLSYYLPHGIEAGCDEAGRGCLAGPVYAAAVVLPRDYYHPLLNDSKMLNPIQREEIKELIKEESLSWTVSKVYPKTIDKINILNATIRAMHLALERLYVKPTRLLIDGNTFKPYKGITYKCIIKGDRKYFSIAAASVLAKTYRDAYMKRLHKKHPEYNWFENKGYPTKDHRYSIRKFGLTKYHRRSFRVYPQLR